MVASTHWGRSNKSPKARISTGHAATHGPRANTAIREKERLSRNHIPIITMTAYAAESDRARCISVSMDNYVSKPI